MTHDQKMIFDSGLCPSCHCEITSGKCFACSYFHTGAFTTQKELDKWNSGEWSIVSLNGEKCSEKADVHASPEFEENSVNLPSAGASSDKCREPEKFTVQ